MWFDKIFRRGKRKGITLEEFLSEMERRGFRVEQFWNEVGEAYRKHWVFAGLDRISKAVAMRQYKIFKGDKEVTEGAVYDRVARPGGGLSYWDYMYISTFLTYVDGEVFWYKMRSGKNPLGYFLVRGGKIDIVRDEKTGVKLGYVVYQGKEKFRIDNNEMVWIKMPDVTNPYGRGKGILDVLKPARERYEYMSAYEFSLLKKGRPSLVISGFEDYNEMKRVIDDLNSALSKVEKMGAIIGVLKGQQAQKVTFSPSEMDFTNTKKITREEIAGILGHPLALYGITEQVNRANMETAMRMFELFTVIPLLVRFEYAWNELLKDEGIRYEVNKEVMSDTDTEDRRVMNGVRLGIITRNEARNRWGFEQVQDGDVYLVPATILEEGQRKGANSGQKDVNIQIKKSLDERGLKFWIGHIRLFNQYSESMQEKVVKFYKDIFNRVLKNMRVYEKAENGEKKLKDIIKGLEIFLIDKETGVNMWYERTEDVIRTSAEGSALYRAASIGATINVENVNLRVLEKFRSLREFYKNTTVDYVLDWMRENIEEGLEQGLSIKEIVRKLKDEFPSLGRHARTVARTEIKKATGLADFEVFNEVGAGQKQWWTALDERVRDWHLSVHGQIVPVNQPFIVDGEELMYPGDFGGSPHNVINCRCVMVLPEE